MSRIIRSIVSVLVAAGLIAWLGLGLAGSTEAHAAATYPQQGQRSAQVTELQQRLVKAKTLQSKYVTGYFGDLTATAVKAFQKKSKLPQTGKVNAKTWDTLVKQTGKTTDKLHYMVDSKVVQTMDARFGCANMKTREGRFSVQRKSRHHVSSIYHTPMPYAMFFSGGQAVHYSADFAKRGYRGCSHGCVNLRDRAGIAWLFGKVRVGDRVVVYKS